MAGKGDKPRKVNRAKYEENFTKIFSKKPMKPTLLQALEDCKFYCSRMISGSKSYYLGNHPDHDVIFNANIISKTGGKIWWGDLDLTLDSEKLQQTANESGEEFLVLREMDARFENEEKSYSEYSQIAKAKFSPQ